MDVELGIRLNEGAEGCHPSIRNARSREPSVKEIRHGEDISRRRDHWDLSIDGNGVLF